MPLEQCDRHSDCMERIHKEINEINVQSAESKGLIEGFTTSTNNFIDAIRKDIYSPGGMVERVGSHQNQIGLQWGLMAVLVAAVVLEWIFKK